MLTRLVPIIALLAAPLSPSSRPEQCSGCIGAGGGGSGGSGGATVSNTIVVGSGECKPVLGGDPPTTLARMSPLMFRIFSLVAIALAAASMKARAAPLTETDVRQMQSVVEAQLSAFASGDASCSGCPN